MARTIRVSYRSRTGLRNAKPGAARLQSVPADVRRGIASRRHTVVVLAAIAAWVAWGKVRADQLRLAADPHRISLYLVATVVEWLMLGLVLWGAPPRVVLGPRWESARALVRDIAIAGGFWVVSVLALGLIRLALHIGSTLASIRFLLPQGGVELALWVALSISAGVCEEAIFRGYLQPQMAALTNRTDAGILISAACFGVAHAYQGLPLVIVLAAYGAMFGLLAHWRKSPRPGMIAHAWQDSATGLLAALLRRAIT